MLFSFFEKTTQVAARPQGASDLRPVKDFCVWSLEPLSTLEIRSRLGTREPIPTRVSQNTQPVGLRFHATLGQEVEVMLA
jgi:hypothetical protein